MESPSDEAFEILVVSDEEFEHFMECMNNPAGPTSTLLAGIELWHRIRDGEN